MRLRMIPFARQLKHGRMFFTEDITLTTLLPKYPTNLTKSERLQVESMVRAASATFLPNVEHLKGCDWPKYFWRHNYDLTVCQPVERRPPPGFVRADTADIETLSSKLESAASSVSKYMGRLASRIQIDLYDPRRDEVLLGLFARVSRLFILMMDDPRIWARDVGSIILRCLAETAITFVYLVKKGKVDEFEKFVSYGEGQRKLLMLHLQDNYPTATSHDGMTAEEAEKSLDVFPGLIDIELGHWAGQDVRRLAQKAGMERLYRLVFSPASGEVHGNWLALKDTSLTYCAEPLHRIHRLPALAEPPFYVTIAETARTLWEHCHEVAVEDLRYPDVEPIPRFK